MLKTSIAVTAMLTMPALASAQQPQQPIGDWLVKDKVAIIKIDDCGGAMWGVVAWEKDPGGIDDNNPDPAKRGRPVLGMPVLLAMKPTNRNRWEGEIYNAQDGKTYSGRISLSAPDVLRVEGCVLGFLCGGEEWTRVQAEPTGSADTRRETRRGAAGRKPQAAASEVCSRVSDAAGPTHQGRLK